MSKQSAEEPTVAWRLFHERFLVSIPEMFLYSEKYIQETGLVSSGDRAVDRQMMLNRREMYLTPAAIAMYHDEGAPVRLLNPRDAMVMYKLIVEHLENWKWVIETQFNYGEAPIDDLKVFDKLAIQLFPLANQFEEFRPRPKGIFEQLSRIRRSPIGLTAPEKPADQPATAMTAIETGVHKPVPGHTPIADAIARQAFKRKGGV